MIVNPAKGEPGCGRYRTVCLKCHYCKRGSFKGLKQNELIRMLHKNPPLKAKLLGSSLTGPGQIEQVLSHLIWHWQTD